MPRPKRQEPKLGERGGDPALCGTNIERRRETDEWNFRFKLRGEWCRGPCYTKDKAKAESFAKTIKAEKKVEAHKDRAAGLGPMTFGRACTIWWNRCRHQQHRDRAGVSAEAAARADLARTGS